MFIIAVTNVFLKLKTSHSIRKTNKFQGKFVNIEGNNTAFKTIFFFTKENVSLSIGLDV